MNVKKLTMLGCYTALALIIFLVEQAFPLLAPLPFLKLGLANVITLIVLSLYSAGDAFLVLLVRVILAAIFAGQGIYLIYSLCGGLLCFFIEAVLYGWLKGRHLWLISIFGAVFHNAGQLLVAIFLMGSAVLAYFPYLMLAGIVTGLFNGVLTNALVPRLRRIFKL